MARDFEDVTPLTPYYMDVTFYGILLIRQALAAGQVRLAEQLVELIHEVPNQAHDPHCYSHTYFVTGHFELFNDWLTREATPADRELVDGPFWRVVLELNEAIGEYMGGGPNQAE